MSSNFVTYRVFVTVEREDTRSIHSDEFVTTREECLDTFDSDDEHENAADAEALFEAIVQRYT